MRIRLEMVEEEVGKVRRSFFLLFIPLPSLATPLSCDSSLTRRQSSPTSPNQIPTLTNATESYKVELEKLKSELAGTRSEVAGLRDELVKEREERQKLEIDLRATNGHHVSTPFDSLLFFRRTTTRLHSSTRELTSPLSNPFPSAIRRVLASNTSFGRSRWT